MIRFRADVKLDQLDRVPIFHNPHIFLNALLEEGGAATTATRYLTRVFVGRICDRLRLVPGFLEMVRLVGKVLNEQDFWTLHEIRLLAEDGKLIARRKKRFTSPNRGASCGRLSGRANCSGGCS